MSDSCRDEVIKQLVDLQRRAADYMNRDGFVARDEFFYAEQNARLVKNAEEYYREMFRGRVSSWNLRDRHMTETLSALAEHLKTQNKTAKIVFWAHNSHLGDARATDMGARGEWNVGQLARKKIRRRKCCKCRVHDTFGKGYGDIKLERIRAIETGSSRARKQLRTAFSRNRTAALFLNLRDSETKNLLNRPRLERVIGVIYRPETERLSHYFDADLPEQFDGVIHFDKTRAVEPLDEAAT